MKKTNCLTVFKPTAVFTILFYNYRSLTKLSENDEGMVRNYNLERRYKWKVHAGDCSHIKNSPCLFSGRCKCIHYLTWNWTLTPPCSDTPVTTSVNLTPLSLLLTTTLAVEQCHSLVGIGSDEQFSLLYRTVIQIWILRFYKSSLSNDLTIGYHHKSDDNWTS